MNTNTASISPAHQMRWRNTAVDDLIAGASLKWWLLFSQICRQVQDVIDRRLSP